MKSVLLVDRSIDMVELVTMELEKTGWKVFSTTEYHQAIAYLKTVSLDLVITGMRVVNENNRDLIITLQKEHPYMNVILHSNHPHADSIHQPHFWKFDNEFWRMVEDIRLAE